MADVLSVAELVAGGVSRRVLGRRVRDGRWQRVLPGVVVTHSGPVTGDQRRRAGLIYAGRRASLSHRSAAVLHGLRISEGRVEVTVPHSGPRPNTGFVVVHQTRRPSAPVFIRDLPCTPVARTVVDVACTMRRRDDVRALVSDAVQRRLATVDELDREAGVAARHGCGLLRRALEEVTAGARSAGEGAFLRLVVAAGLPMPELGARIETPQGWFLLDALWREQGVGVEIDGRAWHLDAVRWARDLRRQNLITTAGIVLLRFPVTRIRDDPGGVVADLRRALHR